ncbi:MAG TPA: hypothetical protein VFX12_11135, partial [Vicinamibacterales bacterium]|nr:hypothetical protein [Vicinamibacterales bacterium]
MGLRGQRVIGAAVVAVSIAAVAYAADVFGQLGIDEGTARGAAVQAALNATRPYYGSHAFKIASASARASIVREALTWAKAFTNTEGFRAEYARLRQAEMPSTPPKDDPPYAEQLKKNRADFEKTAAGLKALAGSDPKQQKQYEDMVA